MEKPVNTSQINKNPVFGNILYYTIHNLTFVDCGKGFCALSLSVRLKKYPSRQYDVTSLPVKF